MIANRLGRPESRVEIGYTLRRLGRRQAVSHRSLEPAFAGSNPAAPAR
jgi:hypothetical protein